MADHENNVSLQEHPSDELDSYLAAVARGDCYRVIRPLGAAARVVEDDLYDQADMGTVTELVQFEGANGAALGPFVRKRIDFSLGIGTAYEDLYTAQQAGARFAHIPRLVECYKTGHELVVVSEYVPGETLEAFIHRVGSGAATARLVVPAVCAAVAELHEAFDPPIVHRDLKPSNIIITYAGREQRMGAAMPATHATPATTLATPTATLIDFGIARRYRADASADTARFGTRSYAPPEQYGFGQTSVRSDIYALGMIALYCFTGEEPQGQPTAQTLTAAGVPAAYAAVILRATAFDPAQRYGDAQAFETAFSAASVEVGENIERIDDKSVAMHAPTDRSHGDAVAAQDALADISIDTAFSFVSNVATGTSNAGTDASNTTADSPSAEQNSSTRTSSTFISALLANLVSLIRDIVERIVTFVRRCHTVIVGHIWNLLLIITAVLFVAIGSQSLGEPINGVVEPLWYSAFLTYGFSLPLILGTIYLMLDRKSLARVAPRLAARSRLRDLRNLVIYAFIAVAVCMVLLIML